MLKVSFLKTFFIFQGDIKVRVNGAQFANIGEKVPIEVVVENLSNDTTDVLVLVMKSNNYVIDSASSSYKLTIQKEKKR